MMSKSPLRLRARDMYEKRKEALVALFGKQTLLDELSFVAGVVVLLVFQALLFGWPHRVATAYSVLLLPLMVARFLTYRRQKWHMFMLDHCYFVSWTVLQFLWFSPRAGEERHAWLCFALSVGPLMGGMWMWKNSLVFSDLDRFTSTFIHFVPSLVMYCERFFGRGARAAVPPLWEFVWRPLVTYIWWQVFYLIKTELLDRKRFEEDERLTTSLRWMTKKSPHPVYLFVVSKPWGKNVPPVFIIVTFQFGYTVVLLAAAWVLAHSQRLTEAWLAASFLKATWNGGKFYLEILAEKHAKQTSRAAVAPEEKKPSLFVISSSRTRFVTFVAFIAVVLGGYRYLLTHYVLV
jgi:hypothetical protein